MIPLRVKPPTIIKVIILCNISETQFLYTSLSVSSKGISSVLVLLIQQFNTKLLSNLLNFCSTWSYFSAKLKHSVIIIYLCYSNEIKVQSSKFKIQSSIVVAKFTGKHLYQSLFFKKSCRSQASNFIKKETLAQVFYCEFLRNF